MANSFAAASAAYAKRKGITLNNSTGKSGSFAAASAAYAEKLKKKQEAEEERQQMLSRAAQARAEAPELPRVEPEPQRKLSFQSATKSFDEQKKQSFLYSSALQQVKQREITEEDRKFAVNKGIIAHRGIDTMDDEIKVAKYYYDKAKADGATKEDKQRWKDIKSYIANRISEKDAQDILAKKPPAGSAQDLSGINDAIRESLPSVPLIDKAAVALSSGIREGVNAPIRAVGTIFGNDRFTTDAFAIANQLNMHESTSKVEQLALSAVESIGRMVPSQLIGMATHPAVGSVIMGLGSAESAYEESLKEGATPGKAKVFGALVGAAEAAMGYFLGGIPGLKQGSGKILDAASEGVEGIAKSTLKKIAPKALSSIDNVMAKIIKNPALRQGIENYIGNIGSEAVEESLQSVFESGLKKWLLGQKDTKLLSTETLESGLLGGVIAAVLGIPGIAIDTTNAANAPIVTAPQTNVETDTTTEAETETETAKPKITEADLQAALDDAAKVKASSRGTAAAKHIYTDGEVTAKEIQHIMSSPEGRAALELYFDTKLDSQTKASDVRKTIRAVAEQRKAQLASDPAAKLVADVEAGRITAAEILADEANIEALQAEYDRLEAKVKAAEEADPTKGGMYRVTADGHKVLNIGLQFFANKPKTATARPANAPRQAPQEAQTGTEAPTQATTPPETETPSTSPTGAAQPTDGAYQRPEGPRKFGETVINSKYISESSANALKVAYNDKRTFAYEKGTNADQIKAAEEKWNVITDEGKNMAAAVGELNRIFESGDRLSAEDGAFAVYAINRANAANDLDGLVQLAEKISFLATESGQFIQTLSMISKLSPQGQLIANQRLAKKYEKRIKAANEGKKQTLREKKETERKLEQTKKKLAEVKRQQAETIDITEDVNSKLAEINEELEAYKDINRVKRRLQEAEERNGKLTPEERAELLDELEASTEAYRNISSLERRLKYYQRILGKLTPEEIDFWAKNLRQEWQQYKDLSFRRGIINRYEKKLGRMSEEERQFWIDEFSKGIADYRDIRKKQRIYDKLEEQVGKLSEDERQAKIAELEREIAQLKDLKKHQNRAAYYEEQLGKMSEDERLAKIAELTQKADEYKELKAAMTRLKKYTEKLGEISPEEMATRSAALQDEISRYSAYNEILKSYVRENRSARKLVEKEIELQAEINKLQGKVELSDYVQFMLASAKTTAEMNEARNAALKEIALQTPITYIDVIEWLRYGAMLSGPLSNMRNMASNAINFAVAQTVVLPSTLAEKVIPKDRRVSSVINLFSAKDKALIAAAKSTYADVETELKTGDKVERASAVIARNRTTGNKAVDFALRDFWSKPLDWGDTPFLFSSYVLSYAQACKARGLDPNTATEAQLEEVKAYAIAAAQQATFRRTSETASWLSRLERQGRAAMTNPDAPLSKRIGGGLVYTAIGGLAPFKSVPANILNQGAVDYTPLGIADGIRTAYKSGKVDGQAIQKMCKGMTGTMIMGLGALLSSLGLLHANDDEKEAQYLKSLGQRNYSIDIGNLNISGTWVGPVAIPLFMGATINEICADGFEFDEILNIIASVIQPVVDTTVLSGVNDYITTIQYNGSQGAAADPFASYFGSFSPALLNSINKTFIDPKRRTSVTTASSGGAESVVKYAVNNYMSRTPGLSYELPVYVDCWGREEDTGKLPKRFANNFLNFASAKEMNISDVDREIIRLYGYEVDGVTLTRKEVIPPMDNVKILDGDLHAGSDFAKELTTDEIIEFRKHRGTTAYDTLEALFKTKQYSDLPDDTKALAIDMAYTYASATAKMEMCDLTQDTWVIKAYGSYGGLSAEEVILCRAVLKDISGKDNISKALRDAGLGKISDKYWNAYESSSKDSKKAYQKYLERNKLTKYTVKSKAKEGE